MEILNNVSLKAYNTFGIEAEASFFSVVNDPAEVQDILTRDQFRLLPKLIIGGGSNILFTKDFEGIVLKINFHGIKHEFLNDQMVQATVGAGEKWDSFVQFCVNQGWGGLENLSLIPGSVGASPIQNIGAYGVEVKDVFSHLDALNLETFETHRFTAQECKFGYRDSVFKNELRNRYLITSVSFLLSQKPKLNFSYPALLSEIEKYGDTPTVKSIAQAVTRIRRSKLPDPDQLGNAGSFFKNPVVGSKKFELLKAENSSIPSYPQEDGSTKIPAAWLIEQCGWKGKRFLDAGVHHTQPLVLVNFGKATGRQILDLANRIKESVLNNFGVELENEVNIV